MEGQDKYQDIDALIVRHLQGEISDSEYERFTAWLHDSEDNRKMFFEMKELFDVRKRMLPSQKQQQESVRRMWTWHWLRYAAVFTVIFGASLVFYLNLKEKALTVPVRQMVVHNTRGVYQLTLPDGSTVWLHGGTTLTYPDRFSDNLRQVELQGEAYFKVQADTLNPFVVETCQAQIRATGTEFNITAYPDDKTTTATLVKGVVDIQPRHLKNSVTLKPSQQALIHPDDMEVLTKIQSGVKTTPARKEATPVIVQQVDAELFTDWKDGVYRFKNEPFRNIVLRLEKMYGMDIRVENKDLEAASFSGAFAEDYSLKEIFEIINLSNPITYHVNNKVIHVQNAR
ncbi:MAG: FecR family protein [Bacteroidales bacterium]|jgi:ferric-dicitrate binding protein FerR (iron transport regulator)|nr:FecR family protein [Bacteroidales bacterium]